MARQQAVLDLVDQVVDVSALLPDDERVRVLDVVISRLQAEQAAALRDLEVRGGLVGTGCKTRGAWARLYLRRQHSAWRLTQRSRLLVSLPLLAQAFAAGEVTDEHVDALLKWIPRCGLVAIQTSEVTLVDLARQVGPGELAEALEHIADLVNADRDGERVKALAQRRITIHKVGDLVHVDAMVEPVLGEAIKTAVESGARLPPGVRPEDDGRTRAQRYADAFGEIVMRGIEAGTTGEPAGRRLRPQVSITVSLETLMGLEGAPRPLLAHFGVLPMPTVHRMICDGDLTRVVLESATGLPLDLGRGSRLAVRRQRRALQAVFRHCAFPGCTVPFRFCEIHHLDWWSQGGRTDLGLLAPYCWTHHHFLHEGGFTVCRGPSAAGDRLIHRRPDGAAITDPQQHVRRAVAQMAFDVAAEPRARAGPDEAGPPPWWLGDQSRTG